MKKVDNKKEVVEKNVALPKEAKVENKPALKAYEAKVAVNVRFEPSMTSNVIGAVAQGEVIEALEEKRRLDSFHSWLDEKRVLYRDLV